MSWPICIFCRATAILGAIPTFKKLASSHSDDWIDRLNHVYTVNILIISTVLVSSVQLVGHPIHCWCPAEFTVSLEEYTRSYCWIHNTYSVPMTKTIPVDIHQRRENEIAYYQWVPIILILQAFLFKLPNVTWKVLNGCCGLRLDKICKVAETTQLCSIDERRQTMQNIASFMDMWLHTNRSYKSNILTKVKAKLSRLLCFFCNRRQGTFLTALYLSVKVLYLLNVVGQFLIINGFMRTKDTLYGFEYIKTFWSGEYLKENMLFPRVTMCDFQIRDLQNIRRWTVQCVLPINLFNEKIFTFLWFWLLVVTCLSVFNFIKWLYLIVIKRNNYKYVKKYLTLNNRLQDSMDKKLSRRFAESYLRDDGCFVARMIGIHAGDMAITDLLDTMWINYRLKECGILDNAQDVESLASDPNTRRSPRTCRRQTDKTYSNMTKKI